MLTTTIIIPQRGLQKELTEPLVAQLQEFEPAAEIIVVDDGRGETASPRDIPGAKIIFHPDGERGLTRAWNLGVAAASGDRVVLLNNDVQCHGPFIKKLSGQGGISGAKMRPDPDVKNYLLEGWCLAFSKDVFRTLVEFDESMKTYFSDTDFQMRALRANYHLTAVEIPLKHLGHKTAHNKTIFPNRMAQWKSDRKTFVDKWAGVSE